jgi:hypothetical protein
MQVLQVNIGQDYPLSLRREARQCAQARLPDGDLDLGATDSGFIAVG